LNNLNAEYDRQHVSDLSFSDIVIPADLQQRMTPYGQANQVEIDTVVNEFNDSNEITVDFEFDNSQAISFFGPAFDNL
jgi:hypothetical protein